MGDWEGDAIIGSGSRGALVSLVERRSNFTLIGKLARKTAEQARDAASKLLEPFKDTVHTITLDYGNGFAYHQDISRSLEADIYFAHPTHPENGA